MQTEKNIWLRVLSMILTLALLISCVPNQVYAMAGEALADLMEREETGESIETSNQTKRGVYEVTELREANVKHFALEDGTYTAAMYGSVVHTQDAEGNWQDIDNRLHDSGSAFSTCNARIKFAKKITGNETLFTLHDGDRKITMSLNNAIKKTTGAVTNHVTEFDSEATQLQKLMTLDNLSSEILYADILDGVDLQYVVESLNVKENIIVKERKDSYQYTFTIALNNLEAEIAEDGSVRIYDPNTKETVYNIPAGFMYDANGECSTAVAYTLTNSGNGKYSLAVTADSDWVNAVDRVFPVVIDPTVIISGSYGEFEKTFIQTKYPYNTGKDLIFLAVGNYKTAYIKPNTLPQLPNDAYIIQAQLSVSRYSLFDNDICCTSLNLGTYPVISDWSRKTLDYHQMSNEDMGKIVNRAYDSINGANSYDEYTWDITQHVLDWYNNQDYNFGLAIKVVDPPANASDDEYRFLLGTDRLPAIAIRYKAVTGIEDYWSYSLQSAGLTGTGYVNNATGALNYLIGTIATTDSLFAYMPTLIYDSHYAGNYFLSSYAKVPYDTELVGRGFKINMFETIRYEWRGSLDSYYVWNDADGTDHYFKRVGNPGGVETYEDLDGLNLTLKLHTDYYTITDLNGTVRRFRNGNDVEIDLSGGILESITDKFGNQLKFVLGEKGRISEVQVVPNGEEPITMLTLHYNSNGLLNKIINSEALQRVEFYYSEDGSPGNGSMNGTGYLTEVRHIYEYTTVAQCQYVYDADGKLICVYDVNGGDILLYTYDDNRAIEVQQLWGVAGDIGQKTTFNYGDGYTEIQSSGADDSFGTDDDVISAYVFDEYARCICCYSMDVLRTKVYGASTGEYETNESAKNSVKSITTLGGVSSNYLFNGGFERLNDTKTEADGWGRQGNVKYTFASTGQEAHDHNSARFPIIAESSAKLYQFVALEPGDYTLSADIETAAARGISVTLNVIEAMSGDRFSVNAPVNEVMVAAEPVNSDLAFTVSETGVFGVLIEVICDETAIEDGAQVYVDNVMLEKRNGKSGYSMVEFGNFEDFSCDANANQRFSYSDSWSCSGATIQDLGTGFGNALYFSQNSHNTIEPYQVVYQATQAAIDGYDASHNYTGQAKYFTLSGMAKGSYQIASGDFGLQVYVRYMNGKCKTFDAEFYYGSDDWQFASTSFATDDTKPIERIEVRLIYKNNPGVVYFDEIYLTQANSDATVLAEYNENGQLTSQQQGDYKESYVYDSDGKVTKTTNNQGEITSYTYDHKGALVKEDYHKLGIVDGIEVPIRWYITTYTYDYGTGNDGYGLLKAITYADLSTIHDGDTTKMRFLETTYEYIVDSESKIFGALISEKDNLDNETRYFYDDDNGRLLAVVNGETGKGTTYTYDKFGRVTSVMPAFAVLNIFLPVIGVEKAEYTYTTAGFLDTITTASTTYSFNYNVYGDLTQSFVGNNQIARYEYDVADGKLEKINFQNATSISYEYNDIEKISAIWYIENGTRKKVCGYSYNASGLLSRYDDYVSNKSTLYEYDGNGRMLGFVEYYTDENVNDFSADLAYDNDSRITNLTYRFRYTNSVNGKNASFVTYIPEYSEDGNLSNYIVAAAGITGSISYTLSEFDRLSAKQFRYTDITTGDVFQNDVSYEYESRENNVQYTSGRIKTYTSEVAGVETGYCFEYDDYGNIIKITVGSAEYRYTYDNFGQLLREDNTKLNRTYVYEYDHAGNIKKKLIYALTSAGTEPYNLIDTYEYGYGDTNWGDKLTAYRGQTITYDQIGNPISYYNGTRYTFTWGASGNLTRAVMDDCELAYKYNDNGLPTTREKIYRNANNRFVIITHKYRYDGNRMITEEWTDESGCTHILVYLYDADNSPIGMQYRNNQDFFDGAFDTYWFEKNLQGDIVAVYDSASTKLISYAYDAWGNFSTNYYNGCTASDAVSYNPFLYRGYYYDYELRMYNIGSKYYDPCVSRLLQASNVNDMNLNSINGANLYAYVINNPINLSYDVSNVDGSVNRFASSINVSAGEYEYGGSSNPNQNLSTGTFFGWVANGLDAGSTIHGLYTGIAGLLNHTIYFSENLLAFSYDMKMNGATIKNGILAFNEFTWHLGKADCVGIFLGVGLDVYDSMQRGVSTGGTILGAALTAVEGVGLLYLNKGIIYVSTTVGSFAGPVGTAVGFAVGGVLCIAVDLFLANWIDKGIDKIAR